MTLKSRLKKLITGLNVPQEYCCLQLEDFGNPLSVIVTLKNDDFKLDVSGSHLFLGYKPLIIGLPIGMDNPNYALLKGHSKICLSFGARPFEANSNWREFPADSGSVARLSLLKVNEKILNNMAIIFYEGEYGEHSFLNPLHQFVNHQRRKFQRDAPNNVGLPGNLVEQVRIAYAIPRLISIVTVSDGSNVNMFPTDLHGAASDELYVSSLRIGGKASEQVETFKRIVVSDVELSSYRQTYGLGKNHMSPLRDESNFSVHQNRSTVLNYPLPTAVLKYRELRQIESLDHGIHRIHLYEVLNQHIVNHDRATLAHIHQYYAQWRIDQGLNTQLFYR